MELAVERSTRLISQRKIT